MSSTTTTQETIPISAGYYDLRQALTEPGCALCRLLARLADDYIDGALWEMVNDPGTRRNLNRARGYCREHAWLLVRSGASLGAAILMRDVIETLLEVVETATFDAASTGSLSRVWHTFNRNQPCQATAGLVADLSPQQLCPVCAVVRQAETYYLETLLKHLTDPDGLAAAYRASDGFCLPHFRLALTRIADEEIFTALVEAQKAVWQRLKADLSEFIRKNDYRFQHEGFGKEGDSWQRAIEAVSGAPPVKVRQWKE
jgi:hypothetical protein